MAQDLKAFITRYIERFNHDAEACLREYVEDNEFVQHVQSVLLAFPNYQLVAEDMVAEGEKICVRARFQGVHRGEFMGVPASGNRVDVAFIGIYRVANGKVVQHWLQADMLSLMGQIAGARAHSG